MLRILILSGEASGDLHGASLATALRALRTDVMLEGIGGPQMAEAGVKLITGIEKLDIIGVPTLSELRRAYAVFRKLSHYIRSHPFDAVVLIDNPGLNLRLARVAKNSGHKVVYYIAPQIWAWNERRIRKMRKYVDRLLAILPFEESYFGKAGVDCRFVGHPIMDQLQESYDVAALRKEFGIDPDTQVIGLLPGSRKSEVQRLLPVMLEAAAAMFAADAEMATVACQTSRRQFVLARASALPAALIDHFIQHSKVPIKVIADRPFETIALCDAVIVASGTATLQTALVGRPMTIVYKTSALTYHVFKRLIRVPWIGLANLIAGRQIAKELIQDDLTPENLVRETLILLNPERASLARDISAELRQRFGTSRVSDRAAAEIMDVIALPPAAIM